jgi:hypothetical protein
MDMTVNTETEKQETAEVMESKEQEDVRKKVLLCERVTVDGREYPGDCSKYIGSLDYYLARHEDFIRRHPDKEPPVYYLKHGDKPSRRFMNETKPNLTPRGQAWLERTFINLQKAIEKKRKSDSDAFECLEIDSEAFTSFAYGTHSGTYIKAGFSELPADDIYKITRTIKPGAIFTKDGLKQTVIIAFDLLKVIMKRALKRFFGIIRGKRK